MEKQLDRIETLILAGKEYFRETTDNLLVKPEEGAWSKQEILGHLVDSAINNIVRFTEVQFKDKPYTVNSYDPDGWVAANDYQNVDTQELVNLWIDLNDRIMSLMKAQTEETLVYPVILPNGEEKDLKFLMEDYIDHLEHHLDRIGAIS